MKPCAKNRKRIALLAMPHDNAVYLDVDTEVCRSVRDFRSLNPASQDVPEAEEFGAIDIEFRDAGLELANEVRQAGVASRKKRGT